MDTKVNYTLVGAFVIFLSISLILIGFWLSFGLSHKTYNTYIAYFNESVNGLSIDAPVKYNGVTIGFVRSMQLNPHNYNQVKLLLAIDTDITIKQDTRAMLMSQGLTGLNIINLTGGNPNSPELTANSDEEFPVIQTEPSLLVRLDTMIGALSNSLLSISGDIKAVLNPKNRMALQAILASLEITSHNSAVASAQLPNLINRLNQTSTNLSQQTLPQMTETLNSVQRFSQHLDQLSSELADNPSLLIRGRQTPKGGPGE